ncbi:MAG: hypothetical protein ACHQWV_03775 [Nitrospirales bacterium]
MSHLDLFKRKREVSMSQEFNQLKETVSVAVTVINTLSSAVIDRDATIKGLLDKLNAVSTAPALPEIGPEQYLDLVKQINLAIPADSVVGPMVHPNLVP